jgi:hypothetical protein
MANHNHIKDISIAVGTYTGKDGKPKYRYRKIGEVWETEDSDGKRQWARINGEAIAPGLLTLNLRATKSVEDSVAVTFFDVKQREPEVQKPAADDDNIPY